MVEVTRSNFDAIFREVEFAIRSSSYIAIDAEFTGLTLGSSNENNLFDSVQERYEKFRCRTTSFIPCQIGLSMFIKSEEENSYFAETYVFYVRPCMIGSLDRLITCQASALDFLSKYDFNFQKFIQEGIPYINEEEEVQVRQEIEDGSIHLPHEKMQDPRHLTNMHHELAKLLNNLHKLKTSEQKIILPIDRKTHVYFQLCEIRRKYQKLWAYVENDKHIVVKVVSAEEKERLIRDNAEELKWILGHFLGFTKVFRILKECQKPIVGHNLLTDLMLFYQNFHRNLPVSYEEFKKELHSIFPVIYDTKHIWLNIKKVHHFKKLSANSSLTSLYELFKNPPDYLCTLYSPNIGLFNCMKYSVGDFVHDSGYDAFMTGFVFLKVCHVLASERTPAPVLIKPLTFKEHLKAISPFLNKVNIPYFRLRYINLEGADPPPHIPPYLYVATKASNGILSNEQLNIYFNKYNPLEFKFIKRQKAALVASPNTYTFKKILTEFKEDPHLIVEEYKFLRHSPHVSATLWLALASGGLIAAWIWRSS